MSDFKSRLVQLWGADAAPSVIASEIGMSTTGFLRVWNEGAIPKAETLIKISEVKHCSIDWLLTGKGNAPGAALGSSAAVAETKIGTCCLDTLGNPVDLSEFVFIPRYNVKAAAGHGSAVEGEKPMFSMSFRRYWIENYLRVDPRDLSVLSVKGDSMEGVLNDRDVILVNHADRQPTSGLYVLRLDEDLIVKRVQKLPGGKLRILSANEAYDPFEVEVNSPEVDFAVIGRVVWFGRQI
ncbi:S24 family peptidase [Aquitalea magnusonii]|nr:helix-turn-helix transcriptional regulator [Aquitalea magnusonii]